MPLKLNPAVLLAARESVDRARERLRRTGIMLDPRFPVMVRGLPAVHCNHHRHSDEDRHNLRHAPPWKALREKVLGTRGPRCENCPSVNRLVLHHRYYFPGHEVWEYEEVDLVVLCKVCHSIVHNRLETAELVIYYELCWRRLQEVEEHIQEEEDSWEMDRALGRHSDPTIAYDEDNPGYWEDDAGDDLDELVVEGALHAEMDDCYDELEDD
ncbi:MAG TPA: hypothetical protein VEY93_02280 [Longimicrobium sp.]|nr:hypothetical protein [Longimicrobium sp.]